MEKFSKTSIAMTQLCDAIDLFNSEKFISSITLSGAVEDIFAQLLKQKSKESEIPLSTAEKIESFLFGLYPGIDSHSYHINPSRVRNELKHHGDKRTSNVVSADFKSIALTHINGAITNYRLVKGELPKGEIIVAFCNKVVIN